MTPVANVCLQVANIAKVLVTQQYKLQYFNNHDENDNQNDFRKWKKVVLHEQSVCTLNKKLFYQLCVLYTLIYVCQ